MTSWTDARERIVDTARDLLDERGASALSMREVARRSGVTHQAPYHYFADRESILAEVVTRGFADLEAALREARIRTTDAGSHALVLAAGQAYLHFALSHPGVFRVMFRADLCDPARFPEARDSGARAFAELGRLVQTAHHTDPDPVLEAIYWAQIHGLATLIIDGPLMAAPPERDHFLDAMCGTFADRMLGGAA